MREWVMRLLMAAEGDGGGSGGGSGDGGGEGGEGDKGGSGDGASKKDGEGEGSGGKKDSGAEGDGKKGSEGDGGKGDGEGSDGAGKDGSETGKGKQADKSGASGPPEKYELTSPEEWDHFDQADLDAVAKIARANGWSNDEAQAQLNAHGAALKAQSERFLAETQSDPDLGGDKLNETLTASRRALDALYPAGTTHGDEMRALLDRTGYTNHRVIIRHFADLARRMGEDLPTGSGRGAGGGEKSAADTLYDGKGAEG